MKTSIPQSGKILLQASSTDIAPIREIIKLIQHEEDRLLGPVFGPSEKFELNVFQFNSAKALAINGVRAMLQGWLESIPEYEKAIIQEKKESLHTPSGWS